MELLYALLIIVVIACLIAIAYIFYYNKLQENKLKVNEAESIIDENLRKKYDLLIDIKNIITKQVKNKKINFDEIDNLKEEEISNFDFDRKLEDFVNLINTVLEDNKKIKDDKDITKKFNEIKEADEKISTAKTFYNKYIAELNALVLKFPSNIIARFHNIKSKNFFDNKDMTDENINDFKI